VTFGSHSRTHPVLSQLTPSQVRDELYDSRLEIERVLGRPCGHLAYPYGNAQSAGPREYQTALDAGYQTAVTTNRGLVTAHYRSNLTALPRIPLEGDAQDIRVVEIQLSGAPFALKRK